MKHSDLRANERYGIEKINETFILNEILDDKCVLIKSDLEKFSMCFMVLFGNKYVKVVTDYNLRFVKTLLPYENKDFDYICQLTSKLAGRNTQAA
ncbi:MAG: hypothetical protein MJ180_02835 [Candidatus Gastranaerophilales bacterium]|nr:hypothetical protein [Candidatus Gastranaerophilales bacterium]